MVLIDVTGAAEYMKGTHRSVLKFFREDKQFCFKYDTGLFTTQNDRLTQVVLSWDF